VTPGTTVRLDVVQSFTRWINEGGGWHPQAAPLRGWAEFMADANGTVDSAAVPLRGTYHDRSRYGLMWSGRKAADPLLAGAPSLDASNAPNAVWASVAGHVIGRDTIRFVDPPGLRVATVADPGLSGAYAAPADGSRHPVVLLLHGSEGGDPARAREMAVRYAGKGFAAFAVNWFALDLAGIARVPNDNVNLPVEIVDRARSWVAAQPEADARRFGVFGLSKGAELAEVAAVRHPWITAIAACVPTDVVWEGYGTTDPRNRAETRHALPAIASSWSFKGKPLRYVPLRAEVSGPGNPFFDNTERYDVSRAEHPRDAAAARIRLERFRGHVLLLGSGRDEVWASGRMADALVRRFRAVGRAANIEAIVYPDSGHEICGDGLYPPRVWHEDSSDARRPDLDAQGAAAVDAWQRTVGFFRRTLISDPSGSTTMIAPAVVSP
jgi:dienelactone hydrolase